MSTRKPAVSDQFYPGDPDLLARTVAELTPAGVRRRQALAVVSPHAGYVYSGRLAAETIARVRVPGTVIVIGPNHHGLGPRAAVMACGAWLMPTGRVEIDEDLAASLLAGNDLLEDSALAHRHEHSLEVQIPFLQAARADLRIVPLTLSRLSLNECLELGGIIARAIEACGREVLIVASSDMTHYEPRERAEAKDRMALERLLALDPRGLFTTVVENRITMCGVIPVTVTIAASLALGASKAELVRYTDSGEVSGDTGSVVGYAGVIIG